MHFVLQMSIYNAVGWAISSAVERLVYTESAGSSILSSPTIFSGEAEVSQPLAYLLAFLAMVGYASLPVLAKTKLSDIPPLAFIAVAMASLSLYAGVASLLIEKHALTNIRPENIRFLLFFAAINFFAFISFLSALKVIPVFHYQTIVMLSPVIGGIFAYYLMAETVSLRTVLGYVLAAFGVFLAIYKPAAG